MKQTILLISLLLYFSINTKAQNFQSNTAQTQLVELYSSQGCSSCPPADKWVSNLIHNPQLWKTFIPLVFHVDYWNQLGWKDPYSSKIFSKHQRNYHYQGAISSVYTPGFILNGTEWRDWFRGKQMTKSSTNPGILSAVLDNNTLHVSFKTQKMLNLNYALLGFGMETSILNGENTGRNVTEDFVVLDTKSMLSDNGQWKLPVNISSQFKVDRYAIAIWVNSLNDLYPIQSTGDWIERKK